MAQFLLELFSEEIPARMQATRLPGKPLADIAGTPMIVHVWRRAVAAKAGDVVVATDSGEIADAVTAAGGKARSSVFVDSDLRDVIIDVEQLYVTGALEGDHITVSDGTAVVGSGTVANRDARSMRSFTVPWIPHDDFITPQDVQGVRAFGVAALTTKMSGLPARSHRSTVAPTARRS